MHEALTLICRLASNPAVSATTLATLTTNKTVTRFSITVVNRLISRGTLSEALQLQGKHAIVSADTIELSRGLRRRILDNIPHHQGWGEQKQALLLCGFPFIYIILDVRMAWEHKILIQEHMRSYQLEVWLSDPRVLNYSRLCMSAYNGWLVRFFPCIFHLLGGKNCLRWCKTLLQFWVEVEICCMNGELFCSCAYIDIFGNKAFSFLCGVLIP